MALKRVAQVGAKPVSWVRLACELQRDWACTGTAPEFKEILVAGASRRHHRARFVTSFVVAKGLALLLSVMQLPIK